MPAGVRRIEARGRIARSSRARSAGPGARRALAAGSWTSPEAPLAEESEAYDGATVLRTLATATTSVTYASAQQIADWGALLGPDDALDVHICQLSASVGRGPG